jgi:23S rRNA (uracil1939-C5)-methyltransferase
MELRLEIEKLVTKGDGLARHEGKAVFVCGALPGETVMAVVTETKGDYLRAQTSEVLVASDQRAEPSCPYYGECGGCDLQHASIDAQVDAKQAVVEENLMRIGGIDVSDASVRVLPVARSSEWGYRSRVRFHVDIEGNRAGFLARQSNDLVDIHHCPILCDSLDRLLGEKRALLMRAARMRKATEGWQQRKRWVEVPAFAGDERVSLSTTEVSVEILDKKLWADSNVIFQSNRTVLPEMVEFVRSHVTGTSIVDLYAGVGTFSAYVEGPDRQVVAVERDKRCLELAQKHLSHTEFFTQSAEHWGRSRRSKHVDSVIVDPPRTGLDRDVIEAIASWKPGTIIYISCDSVTLARDCKRLSAHGYRVDTLQVFDLYPQTSHIECGVVLAVSQERHES